MNGNGMRHKNLQKIDHEECEHFKLKPQSFFSNINGGQKQLEIFAEFDIKLVIENRYKYGQLTGKLQEIFGQNNIKLNLFDTKIEIPQIENVHPHVCG